MQKTLWIVSGTFQCGCGIIVRDNNWNVYHLLVLEDKKTGEPYVELHGEIYTFEQMRKK